MPIGTAGDAGVEAVRWGVWASGLRCVLVYVVGPLAGGLAGLLGAAGMSLQLVATVTTAVGVRSLFRVRHPARVPYLLVAVAVWVTTALAAAQWVQWVMTTLMTRGSR